MNSPPPSDPSVLQAVKDWLVPAGVLAGWIASVAILWTRLTNKVNGLGGRVTRNEVAIAAAVAHASKTDADVVEYRHDVQEMAGRMGRLEKTVEELKYEVEAGTKLITLQLREMDKSIAENNLETRERLIHLETIQGRGQP